MNTGVTGNKVGCLLFFLFPGPLSSKLNAQKHRQIFFTGSALAMRQTCDFGLVVALVTGFSGVLNILKTSGVKEISLLAFSECAKMVFRMDHSTYAEKQSSALIKMGVIPHPMNTHY